MKEIINIIIGNEDISILDNFESSNKEVFERYKKIVKILISKCKVYYNKGLKIEQLINIVKAFYSEYNQNVILRGYYEHNLYEEQVEEEITNILERFINSMNISLIDEIDNSFKTSGKIDAKTLKQKKISDIHNRVKIGNESSADLFVSIHLNKIPQQQYDGWQTFYKAGSNEGKKLAESIQNNLNEAIQKENNRIAKTIDNIYIIKHVEIPITIVECGFLSNPDEEKLLLTDDYQNKLAWGIYNGIIDYFNEF